MVKVYLAGCMSYFYSRKKYKRVIEWRLELVQKLLDCNANLCENHFSWFDPTINFEDNVKTANNKTVVQQNNHYLDECNILIVNLDEVDKSPGTLYEIFYYGIQNKPVIAFGDNDWTNSPHIAESVTVTLKDINEVVDYLMSYFVQ